MTIISYFNIHWYPIFSPTRYLVNGSILYSTKISIQQTTKQSFNSSRISTQYSFYNFPHTTCIASSSSS